MQFEVFKDFFWIITRKLNFGEVLSCFNGIGKVSQGQYSRLFAGWIMKSLVLGIGSMKSVGSWNRVVSAEGFIPGGDLLIEIGCVGL